MARLRRDARRDRGSSAGIARRLSPRPAAGRRLPQPSGRGGHAIRGPVLRAAQEPRATSRGGRAGGRPYPVCPVGWGGATSVPRADAARPGRSPAAEAQLWRDRRRLHGFAASGRKLFAQLGRPSPRCGEGSRFRARPGPAPRPRAPGGGPGAAGARPLPVSRSPGVASRKSAPAARPPADPRLGPGRDYAPRPLGAGDRRKGGAAARPGERPRLSARPKPRTRPRAARRERSVPGA